MANRRPVEWQGQANDDYATSGLGSVTRHTIVNAATLSEYTKPTMVRLSGRYTFKLNAATAMTTSNVSAFQVGIAVVHEDVTSLDPEDSDEDWVWRESGILIRAYQTSNSGNNIHVNDVSGIQSRVVDVRAMRKIPSDHHMIALFVHAYDLDGNPSSLQHFGHCRALIKE